MLNRDTFTKGHETSAGPLDVSKSAGSDLTEMPDMNPDMRGDAAPQIEENERQRNRLGYTVTEETEAELNNPEPTEDDPLDDGENTQQEMINHAPSGRGL